MLTVTLKLLMSVPFVESFPLQSVGLARVRSVPSLACQPVCPDAQAPRLDVARPGPGKHAPCCDLAQAPESTPSTFALFIACASEVPP